MADPRKTRVALCFLGGFFLTAIHAFIPLDEFVHRSDDAFYYFNVALNFPEFGFWTFDGIHATNGVQPLWAILLSGIAQLFAWVGIRDPHIMARVFVGATALAHFASVVVLYRILERQVSSGTALVAAGALLFPLGIVWGRVWGMESALYALLLLLTVAYFHFTFRRRPSVRTAIALGILLALTALTRLNAGFLIPCVLGSYLLFGGRDGIGERIKLTFIMGSAASVLLVPYFLLNYAGTGHLLPISGSVKAVQIGEILEERGISSRFSRDYLSFVYWTWRSAPERYITGKLLDGTWILGVRRLFDGYTTWAVLGGGVLALVSLPALLGRPREWFRFLAGRFSRLTPFGFFLAFALLDSFISVWLYPTQMYAIVRWWMVPNEILLIVLSATLVTAFVSYVGRRAITARFRPRLTVAALTVLVIAHMQMAVSFYWDGEKHDRDWNLSWNDEILRAATWINENVPEGARIGSWNAGVLGYYAERPVVNLDGLINNFELLEYMREDRLAEYIEDKQIEYVSDLDRYFDRGAVRDRLRLSEVYRSHSEFMRMDYTIYRVDP